MIYLNGILKDVERDATALTVALRRWFLTIDSGVALRVACILFKMLSLTAKCLQGSVADYYSCNSFIMSTEYFDKGHELQLVNTSMRHRKNFLDEGTQ